MRALYSVCPPASPLPFSYSHQNNKYPLAGPQVTNPEPNGWIQWEEVDHTAFCTDATSELAAVTRLRECVIEAMLKLGLSVAVRSAARVRRDLCERVCRRRP